MRRLVALVLSGLAVGLLVQHGGPLAPLAVVVLLLAWTLARSPTGQEPEIRSTPVITRLPPTRREESESPTPPKAA